MLEKLQTPVHCDIGSSGHLDIGTSGHRDIGRSGHRKCKTFPYICRINTTMYKAKIKDGAQFEIETDNGKFSSNGNEVQFDCQHIGNDRFHIILNDMSINAELISMNKGKSSFVFRVNGVEVELELEDQFDLLLGKLGMEKGAGANVKNIQAPMPGLVLQVNVENGAEVKTDDALLVLEAMKMENVIKAPKDAKVGKVEVEVGQKVDKGQVLISFDN